MKTPQKLFFLLKDIPIYSFNFKVVKFNHFKIKKVF